jgi:DNA-binding winged helix-turn-helix (wHTH) protein
MHQQGKHLFAFGPFRLDSRERVLRRGDQPISLTPKAVDILLILVENAEHLIDKDDLMRRVWPDSFVEEGNLTKNIFILRKALGIRDDGGEYIETVARRGYRFAVPVSTLSEEQVGPHIVPNVRAGRPPEDESAKPLKVERIDLWRGHVTAAQPLPKEDVEDESATISSASPVSHEESRGEAQWLKPAEPSPSPRPWLKPVAVIALIAAGALLSFWVFAPSPSPMAIRTTQLTHFGRIDGAERLVSDGMQIYFTERDGGHASVARVGIMGGEPVRIETPFPNAILYDISINRAELLVGSRSGGEAEGPLWVLPAAGGPPSPW